jgi:hypothetical protein
VNIATLDAIMTHFTRLIDLTSADEEYITSLAQAFSPCILRPRFESSLTMNERHSYRLIRDLFAHKDAIFGELKRQSSALGLNNSTQQSRARSISTDESNRRAAMEARQRAIVNRSRATSPAARTRHRRDRSSGASEMGRFPINVNTSSDRRAVRGTSLDVPTNESAPASASVHANSVNPQVAEPTNNGVSTDSPASTAASISGHSGSPSPPPISDLPETASDGSPTPTPTPAAASAEFEKRNSMSRSSARYSGRKPGLGSLSNFPTGQAVGAAGTDSNRSSIAESEPNRVTLEDKPMDD